jgi:hypothetical protein
VDLEQLGQAPHAVEGMRKARFAAEHRFILFLPDLLTLGETSEASDDRDKVWAYSA